MARKTENTSKTTKTTARKNGRLRVETALGLDKTRPLKANKLAKLNKTKSAAKATAVKSEANKAQAKIKLNPDQPTRKKPESQIEKAEKLNLWLIPARVAFSINALYMLFIGMISVLHLYQKNFISQFIQLPFDPTISSVFLLELTAGLSFTAAILFLHAAKNPKKYNWFYFFVILLAFPFKFFNNLDKLQSEIPEQFYSMIYYDTVIMSVLWGIYLISIFSYFKTLKAENN